MLQQCGGVYELFDPLPEEREWAVLHRFGRRLGLVELMSQTWPNEFVSVRRGVEHFARSLAVVRNERLCRDTLKSCVPAFAHAVERYEDLLSGMQLLSFDGMVEAACNELAPGGKLRHMLEGRISEVFVDEYQDLNRAQEELLGHLVEMGARLTVVGDDDQAIYQWRGGDVSIFLDFNSRFDGARRKILGDNHRSVEPIVTISAKFLSTIKRRHDKPIAAKRADAQPAIELLPAETPENEADLIVQRIRSLLADGHKPGDIAVLYRSVRGSAKPLIDALRRNDIPAAAVGRLSLLDRPEIALVARIFVLWGGGTWYPEEDREVVAPDLLARDMADLTGNDLTETTRIVTELEHMGRQFAAKGVPDLMTAYMKILDMVGIPISGLERSRQEHGLGQLSELLTNFEHAQRRATPPKWYQQIVASAAEESPDSPALQKDAINIMTIHKSKGLEFPIIFVPSLVERRFPSARMGQEQRWYVPEDLFDKARYQGREDDERRLFYVALTRARDLLVLSWFGRYASGTSTDYSPFIRDLVHVAPRDYLTRAGQCRPPISAKPPISRPTVETNFGELYTFHECPYKYYLRHVCGFQPPLDPALNFGKLLHHAVAELARRAVTGQSVTPSDVDEIVPPNCYLPFAGRRVRERLYKSAKRRLNCSLGRR
jgi:DNA helicase-2/ATP-dependent DNA helicase PcrA